MAVSGGDLPDEGAASPATRGRVVGFAGFRRGVTDLARSVAFYRDGLGFMPQAMEADTRWPSTASISSLASLRRARLRLGAQVIELVEYPAAAWRRSPPGAIDAGFQHLAIVAVDMAAAHARVMACGPASLTRGTAPVQLPASAGGVSAFKFLDPDGHPLELIHFPPGSGNTLWQQPGAGAGPTLGIDHSAIVVANAARSIAFYCEGLGFTNHARQVNHGATQDQLDGLKQVTVEVVALQPAGRPTPHLELLCYRNPMPLPADLGRWADRLLWWADDPRVIADQVHQVATGLEVELRDPDGHIHLLWGPDSTQFSTPTSFCPFGAAADPLLSWAAE